MEQNKNNNLLLLIVIILIISFIFIGIYKIKTNINEKGKIILNLENNSKQKENKENRKIEKKKKEQKKIDIIELNKYIKELKNKKIILSNDDLEELSFINNFNIINSKTMDYWIIKTVDSKNITYCNNINNKNAKTFCNNLIISKKFNIKYISKNIKKYQLGDDFKKVLINIAKGNKKCNYIEKDIITYLECKKYFNKNFNANNTLISYKKIFYGDQSLLLQNIDYIILNMGLQSDIKKLIQNNIKTLQKRIK